jgi:hypothetical protein
MESGFSHRPRVNFFVNEKPGEVRFRFLPRCQQGHVGRTEAEKVSLSRTKDGSRSRWTLAYLAGRSVLCVFLQIVNLHPDSPVQR